MSENRNFNSDLGIFGGLLILGGSLFWALWSNARANKIAKRLDLTLDDLSNSVDTSKISEAVIDAAVDKAVTRDLSARIDKAAQKGVKAVTDEINLKVKESVDNAYDDVHDKVERALMKKVGEVDISEIRKEVIEKAKDTAAEKFDHDLELVLSNYNDELSKVAKIYGSIADTFAAGSGRINPFR